MLFNIPFLSKDFNNGNLFSVTLNKKSRAKLDSTFKNTESEEIQLSGININLAFDGFYNQKKIELNLHRLGIKPNQILYGIEMAIH